MDTPSTSRSFGTIRKKSASPFKSARFSPYKLAGKQKSLLNLTGHPHAHPNPPPPIFQLPSSSSLAPVTSSTSIPQFEFGGNRYESATHIKLSFSLRKDGRSIFPTPEQETEIMNLFPTCFGLDIAPPFLVVRCRSLPPKPWPVTAADVPLFLTMDETSRPFDNGARAIGPRLNIPVDIQAGHTPAVTTFITILEELDKRNVVNIDSLEWFGWDWKACTTSEPPADWRSRLPDWINDIYLGFVFNDPPMEEKALRRKMPKDRDFDDESYDDLRPGVQLMSAASSSTTLTTTSGVCIRSPDGEKYVTVARHGITSGVETEVWHPNLTGTLVGRIKKIFGETDIALCELNPGVQYAREAFTTNDGQQKLPIAPFRALADISELKIYSPIYMDTPYSGRCEGNLISVQVRRFPSNGPTSQNTQYVTGIFGCFGNGHDVLFNGCCGGVIWDDSHNVIGQFGWQTTNPDQTCYGPTFNDLRLWGCGLSEQ